MLDIVGGANRDGDPFTGNVDFKALPFLKSVGKAPKLLDELRKGVVFLNISVGLHLPGPLQDCLLAASSSTALTILGHCGSDSGALAKSQISDRSASDFCDAKADFVAAIMGGAPK